MDQVHRNRDDFVWTHVPSIEELGRRRMTSMRRDGKGRAEAHMTEADGSTANRAHRSCARRSALSSAAVQASPRNRRDPEPRRPESSTRRSTPSVTLIGRDAGINDLPVFVVGYGRDALGLALKKGIDIEAEALHWHSGADACPQRVISFAKNSGIGNCGAFIDYRLRRFPHSPPMV